VDRQPAPLRAVLIRFDQALCAAAAGLERLHRMLILLTASAQHRESAERLSRYRRMSRGMRLGCLFVTILSLAAAAVVFWIVLRD
jgi:hypothetical protein